MTMKYITTAVLALGAGVALGLSEDQAAPRKHVLQPIPGRKNWYTTTGPVQFKVGEKLQSDVDLPKGMVELAESSDKQSSKARALEQAAADAANANATAKATADALAAEIDGLNKTKAELTADLEALDKAKAELVAEVEALAKSLTEAKAKADADAAAAGKANLAPTKP